MDSIVEQREKGGRLETREMPEFLRLIMRSTLLASGHTRVFCSMRGSILAFLVARSSLTRATLPAMLLESRSSLMLLLVWGVPPRGSSEMEMRQEDWFLALISRLTSDPCATLELLHSAETGLLPQEATW